jgi:PAS domain S-box-containing protein
MAEISINSLLSRIEELENRLEESEQLIEAIKEGEVDAFAIHRENGSEIYTLQTGDYAYRLLIEEFGEGAVNVTEDGLIVYTNLDLLDLLKLPYDQVIGASIFNFLEGESKTEFEELFHKALSGRSKGEVCFEVNDRQIPVYVSLTSLKPNLHTVGIIITDLSEKKKTDKMILEYQRDLEKKNIALIQSNTELASFAYIASHDLQEPLRKIQTFSTRILQKEFNNLSETGKDHFSRLQMTAMRMQNLIEDLLSYSRTNTVERIFVKTDLNMLVEEVKEELKDEIKQKGATMEVGDLGAIPVIPFQFRQMMQNLISNSLKFSRTDRAPALEIKSEYGPGEKFNVDKILPKKRYCHLSIKDNGIGFEQQYKDKIFDLFQRLHGRTEYVGTGIGLAIVKKIVDNHNGFISANSELNQGATFDIYLPAE